MCVCVCVCLQLRLADNAAGGLLKRADDLGCALELSELHRSG